MSPEAQRVEITRLVSTLEKAVADLSRHVQSPHRFRFVSVAQPRSYVNAFAQWEKNGRVGRHEELTPWRQQELTRCRKFSTGVFDGRGST